MLFTLIVSLTLADLPLGFLQTNKASAAYRTVTITDYWTSGWVNRSSEASPPSVLTGTYYDSVSGRNVSYTLQKSGGLYQVDSRISYINYRSLGRAENYDKETNYYLGFMSQNPITYYAGRFDDPKPGEPPDRYYGIPLELVNNNWQLIDYGWDDPHAINADTWASKGPYYANKLVKSNGSYWWRSERGILNKYRKGVWIDYRLQVKQYRYRQKYTATITLPDTTPPKHVSHSLTGYHYKNGEDYWVRPNTQVTITLRQYDAESDNRFQYLRLRENGSISVRSLHDFGYATNHINKQVYSSHIAIDSANRTEKSNGYGTVQWKVTPKEHNHSYDIEAYYQDYAGNHFGYHDTGMNLRVDGVAPTLDSSSLSGHRYHDGSVYWIRPNDKLKVILRQHDPHSGNKFQYLRLTGNGEDVRARHDFNNSSTANLNQVSSYPTSTANISISEAKRTENTAYGNVNWTIIPKKHGAIYNLWWHFTDNVNNARGYDTGEESFARIGADSIGPDIYFRNEDDTQNFHSRNWSNQNITVRLKFNDEHSGYKRSRYAWSTSTATPSSGWSSWITSSNYTVSHDKEGAWYLHVQAEDNVGNIQSVYKGPYRIDKSNAILSSIDIKNYRYKSGNTYWVRPNDKPDVVIRAFDEYSHLNKINVRLFDSSDDARARFFFSDNRFDYYQPNSVIKILSGGKTFDNGATKEVTYNVQPTQHAKYYNIYYWLTDNAGNDTNWIDSDKILAADGVGPVVQFRNKEDTNDFKNREWSADDIVVRLKFSDAHSGYKRSRYAWTTSSSTPNENQWSSWTTNSNYLTSAQTKKGEWFLHVQAEDNVGNVTTTKTYYYKLNHPPEADMEYNVLPPNPQKDKIFEGDGIKVCVTVRDEDDDPLNVKFYYIYKNKKVYFGEKTGVKSGTTVCENFTIGENDPGRYDIGTEVSDGIFTVNPETWINAHKLFIIGHVNHTPEWEKKHLELGHTLDKFYSGEKFLLEADVADYPIDEIYAIFRAYQADGKPIHRVVPLSYVTNILYDGELFDEKWLHYPTNIRKGPAYFDFEVLYANGVKKRSLVPIEIIVEGSVFDVYKFHRKY